MSKLDRVQTGIAQLDAMLRGGLMRGDATLLAGSAGTGKTTISLQLLCNRATRFNENGVFVSFEQLPEKIYRDAANYGWDLKQLEDENKLRVVCTSPDLLFKTGEIGAVLDEPIRETQAKLICLDSISHLEMYLPQNELRKEIYRLVNYFRTKGLTSVLTSEVHELTGELSSISGIGVSFLADSLILLRYVEIESAIKKVLVIVKMRGSDHDKTLRQYEITPNGIEVSEPFENYEGLLSGSPRRMASEQFAELFSRAAKKRK